LSNLPITQPNLRISGLVGARLRRYGLLLALDGFFAASGLYLGLAIRFEGTIPPEWWRAALVCLPIILAVRTAMSIVVGLHRWSFRLAGLNDAVRLALTTTAGSCLLMLGFFMAGWQGMPRSVMVLEFFLTTTGMAGIRFAPRIAAGWYQDRSRSLQGDMLRTVIVGAGSAGDLLYRDLQHSNEHRYHVIGFVDDDPQKLGAFIHGKTVLGDVDLLPRLIAKHQVDMVLIAIERIEADRIRYILKLCEHFKIKFKIIPGTFTAVDDRITAAMLHDLSPEDLLPRAPVTFDPVEVRAMLSGKRVMVTGAAGSIGGEISRQVAGYEPSSLVLLDVNENELYLLQRRLQEKHPELKIHALVASIRDPDRIRRIGEEHRPHYVFHAAAHKHVPLMEDAPEEAVKNNVFGTLNVARMADAVGAERFVLISTDKAVHPSSVMGVTKRVAEQVTRHVARRSKTSFTAVRFGNVLGSAGSVVPLFKEQIERGGPVTVTHPDCTRYFMTIQEACGLVLLAGLGGHGELCILDMGEPIKIADLAAHMITMAGLITGEDIPIRFTGLRPGEKLNESLLTEEEEQTQVVRNKIRVARSPAPPADMADKLEDLWKASLMGNPDHVRQVLKSIVPTYHSEDDRRSEALAVVMPIRASSAAK